MRSPPRPMRRRAAFAALVLAVLPRGTAAQSGRRLAWSELAAQRAIRIATPRCIAASPAELADRVAKIVIEHLGVEPAKVTPTARFIDDLGADSLDVVELVMAFEEAFGVEIPEDAAARLLTPGDVATYLARFRCA